MQHADHDMVNDCKSPHISLIISPIFYKGVRNSEPYIRSDTSSYFDIQRFLFLSGHTTSKIEVQLTEEMIRIANWLKENDLIINLNKGKMKPWFLEAVEMSETSLWKLLQCEGNQFYNWIRVPWSVTWSSREFEWTFCV